VNDVVIGAWREGLSKTIAADIAAIEKRYHQGFRQLPFESTVMELVHILDAQDLMFADLLVDMSCECDRQCYPPAPEGFEWDISEDDKVSLVKTPEKKPKK
jgi:hypothetical protein